MRFGAAAVESAHPKSTRPYLGGFCVVVFSKRTQMTVGVGVFKYIFFERIDINEVQVKKDKQGNLFWHRRQH